MATEKTKINTAITKLQGPKKEWKGRPETRKQAHYLLYDKLCEVAIGRQ